MAYDETLADRIRALLAEHETTERKMFGGWCVLHNGNMVVGIVRDELMVRVGAPNYERALARPHARSMQFTGRPMTGMIFVDPAGIRTDAQLEKWVSDAMTFAQSVPPKKPKAAATASRGNRRGTKATGP